jgi:hypothetical protein
MQYKLKIPLYKYVSWYFLIKDVAIFWVFFVEFIFSLWCVLSARKFTCTCVLLRYVSTQQQKTIFLFTQRSFLHWAVIFSLIGAISQYVFSRKYRGFFIIPQLWEEGLSLRIFVRFQWQDGGISFFSKLIL